MMIQTYILNIGCELVMAAVLVFLLVSCLLQRKRMVTIKPLIVLISVNLLLLLCQVAEWQLMIASGDQTGLSAPAFREWKILTYSLDYFLGYFSSVSFFHYVREHIRDVYAQKHQPVPKLAPMKPLFFLGIASTAVYAFLMTQSWFYYLQPNGAEWFRQEIYLYFYLIAIFVSVLTMIALLRHRKVLGRLNFWLLMFYKLSPTALLVTDLIHSTCLSYLMRAFYTFILYVHVDLRSRQEAIEQDALLVRQEKELAEMRTQIMLSQIQPHFLYNTFTTVSSLCYLEGAEKAQEVVNKFADYFRQNLDSLGKECNIPFEKELEHIKTYLWIEKVRFEDNLNIEYNIGPTIFSLPSLSVQPLVENAVKHGVCQKPGGGTVTIETQETEDEYLVIVRDDGVGFDPSKKPQDGRSHIGIENIRQRLELVCGGRLEITSIPGMGTTATVHLPKERRENECNCS